MRESMRAEESGDGWRESTLADLARSLEANPDALALVAYGSSARGDADFWSDLDAMVVLRDGASSRIASDPDWLHPLGEPYAWESSASEAGCILRVAFRDLRRIDLIFVEESRLSEDSAWLSHLFRGGSRVVFDRSERLNAFLAAPKDPPPLAPPSETWLEDQARGFRFRGFVIVEKVMRGDLLIALHLVLDSVRDVCVLAMILRDREKGTNVHRDDPESLKRVMRLSGALDPFTAKGILDALAECVRAFDAMRAEIFSEDRGSEEPLLERIAEARQRGD